MLNQSQKTTWTEDGLTFTEAVRQEYSNCVFSSGVVEGHPVDTVYLQLKRKGEAGSIFLLRPDEVAALAWCLTGVLWSLHIEDVPEDQARASEA